MSEVGQRTNRLLALLSADDYNRLRPHLTESSWEFDKKALYEASRPIEQVYFPIDGVASLVLVLKDGFGVEVGTIGSEGMVGLPVILGDTCAPSTVYVQVPDQIGMQLMSLRQFRHRSMALYGFKRNLGIELRRKTPPGLHDGGGTRESGDFPCRKEIPRDRCG
jgi:hypothetical protein